MVVATYWLEQHVVQDLHVTYETHRLYLEEFWEGKNGKADCEGSKLVLRSLIGQC